MKASAIRVAIGIIIFSIGYFVWEPKVGLLMLLAYYMGMLVGLLVLLIEE